MNSIRFISLFALGLVLAWAVQACSGSGPEPINYGHDQCGHCRMTISDARFGCQLATTKGRAFHFDDVKCMIAFVKAGNVAQEDVAEYYLPDYGHADKLLPSDGLFFLKSESLKNPMRGDVAAFANREDLAQVQETHGGEELTWADLWK